MAFPETFGFASGKRTPGQDEQRDWPASLCAGAEDGLRPGPAV